MVQNGGREPLPKKFLQLQYPHLGLMAYCHHKFESSYKYMLQLLCNTHILHYKLCSQSPQFVSAWVGMMTCG